MDSHEAYSDEKMENQMGLLLRSGVVLACGVMIAGGILYLLHHGRERESYTVFHGTLDPFQSIRGVLAEVRGGTARGIIQLGVLIMIATPVLRVAFAIYGFARQRQWVFTAISATVLALLAFGLIES